MPVSQAKGSYILSVVLVDASGSEHKFQVPTLVQAQLTQPVAVVPIRLQSQVSVGGQAYLQFALVDSNGTIVPATPQDYLVASMTGPPGTRTLQYPSSLSASIGGADSVGGITVLFSPTQVGNFTLSLAVRRGAETVLLTEASGFSPVGQVAVNPQGGSQLGFVSVQDKVYTPTVQVLPGPVTPYTTSLAASAPGTGAVATTLALQLVTRDAYNNPVTNAVGPSDVSAFVTFPPQVGLGPYVPTSLEGNVTAASVAGGNFPTVSFATGTMLFSPCSSFFFSSPCSSFAPLS